MRKRKKVINKITGKEIIHAANAHGHDETYSICGMDIAGDDTSDASYDEAQNTNEKINCISCIQIINYCKKIKSTAISEKTVDYNDWAF